MAACPLAFGPNRERRCWWCGQSVPRGRLEWCSQACEAAADDAHTWTRARQAAIRRAGHRCRYCTRRDVEVHHDPPVPTRGGYGPGCQHHPEHLHVLCPAHHRHAHQNLRAKPGKQLSLFRAA